MNNLVYSSTSLLARHFLFSSIHRAEQPLKQRVMPGTKSNKKWRSTNSTLGFLWESSWFGHSMLSMQATAEGCVLCLAMNFMKAGSRPLEVTSRSVRAFSSSSQSFSVMAPPDEILFPAAEISLKSAWFARQTWNCNFVSISIRLSVYHFLISSVYQA